MKKIKTESKSLEIEEKESVEITEEEFFLYKNQRDKNDVHVFEICKIAEKIGLHPEKVLYISDHFSQLSKIFLFKSDSKKKNKITQDNK